MFITSLGPWRLSGNKAPKFRSPRTEPPGLGHRNMGRTWRQMTDGCCQGRACRSQGRGIRTGSDAITSVFGRENSDHRESEAEYSWGNMKK